VTLRALNIAILIALGALLCSPAVAFAQTAAKPLTAGFNDLQLVRSGVLLALMSVVPTAFICMTSFIRIAIVLAMVRHAFGMPETPPNAVLVSLSVLLTGFIMAPTLSQVNSEAIQPFLSGQLDIQNSIGIGLKPLKTFMLTQVRDQDLATMYAITDTPLPNLPAEVDILKLTPAFIINELRVAFTIGFVVLLPFLLIDLVVASVLLALGMMMVPPATISLPIKILMFVLIDGWALIIQGVVSGFR
jgi:flagellar biosynthesis protein FliP